MDKLIIFSPKVVVNGRTPLHQTIESGKYIIDQHTSKVIHFTFHFVKLLKKS